MNIPEHFQDENFRSDMGAIAEYVRLLDGRNVASLEVPHIEALFDFAPTEETCKAAHSLMLILSQLVNRLEDIDLLCEILTDSDFFPRETLLALLRSEKMNCRYRVLQEKLTLQLPSEEQRMISED